MGDSNVYTAERILAKRTFNGVTQYYIKWKGYSARDNTWEPVENILDRGLLTAFERKEAKKTKRTPANSSTKAKSLVKDLDDRENNLDSQSTTPAKVASVSSPPPESPKFERSNAASSIASITSKSPTVTKTATSTPISPVVPKTPPTVFGVSPRNSTSPKLNTSVVSKSTSTNSVKATLYSSPPPPPPEPATVSTSVETVDTRVADLQVEPYIGSIEETTVQRINSISPKRIPTPLPVINNLSSSTHENTLVHNHLPKNRHIAMKFAILNTVITDVTVNDQTITISESKTNQGFFKEVGRHSVAVDTTNSNDCMDTMN